MSVQIKGDMGIFSWSQRHRARVSLSRERNGEPVRGPRKQMIHAESSFPIGEDRDPALGVRQNPSIDERGKISGALDEFDFYVFPQDNLGLFLQDSDGFVPFSHDSPERCHRVQPQQHVFRSHRDIQQASHSLSPMVRVKGIRAGRFQDGEGEPAFAIR